MYFDSNDYDALGGQVSTSGGVELWPRVLEDGVDLLISERDFS